MDRENKAILNYILENCKFAYDELCKINKELIQGMALSSNADVDHLGAMNRVVQDYLIIRVGGLFDKTKGVVSFEKVFPKNQTVNIIKKQEVITYILGQRNNFVAHTNKNHVKNNFPVTYKICESNLKELLQQLGQVLI